MARTPKTPAYSLHKPSGRAVVKVKGRSFYLGKYGSEESQDAYARIIADLMSGRPISPPSQPDQGNTPVCRVTVRQIAAGYQRYAEGYYRKGGKPTSELSIVRSALKFLVAQHGELRGESFGIGDLKVVRASIVEAGLSRGVVNKYVCRIRAAFNWAATEDLIPASVAHALALLPGLKKGRTEARETPLVVPVAEEVVNATLDCLSEVVSDMVRLQLLTGMRSDEVCSIRPMDLDRTGDVWRYRPESHKTEHHGRDRTISIGSRGQAILSPYLLRPEEEFCFRPRSHVAVPLAKKRYRVSSYRQAIIRACDRAFPAPNGMEGEALERWRKSHRWSPHQLRHSFATVVRQTCGLEAAQIALGHASADVTQSTPSVTWPRGSRSPG